MEEKKTLKISLSGCLLIVALIIIAIMGYFMFKLYNERQEQSKNIEALNSQIATLSSEKQELQEKIDTIANTINSNPIVKQNETSEAKILKPSRTISQLFKNYSEAEELTLSGTDPNCDKFYENELVFGDGVWAGLVSEYKASSTYNKEKTDYNVSNLDDLFTENCWCEGTSGNGIGETIEISTFSSSEHVDYYAIFNQHKQNIDIKDVEEYLLY